MSKFFSPDMLRELTYFVRDAGAVESIERVKLDSQGYSSSGRYFGTCAPGERIHHVWFEHDQTYVRSTARAPQLKRALTQLSKTSR